jgi:hypothetical protein
MMEASLSQNDKPEHPDSAANINARHYKLLDELPNDDDDCDDDDEEDR